MEKQGTLRHLKPVEIFPCGTGMCTSVSTMIVTSIFKELISVFNLGISQSGCICPAWHLKLGHFKKLMVSVKLQTMQITSTWRLALQVVQLYELA